MSVIRQQIINPSSIYRIACCLGALCVGFPQGSHAESIPGVGVKIAVSNSKPKPAGDGEESSGEFPRIAYRGKTDDGVLRIEPQLLIGAKETDYLAVLKSGGPIEPPTFGSPQYDVFFPAIDVRVVNNSKSTLHVSRVDLKVAGSMPDPTPLPMIFGGYDEVQHVVLCNEGWGRIEKADFEFDLVAAKPKGRPPGQLPFKRSLQRVSRSAVLSLHDELEKKGVSSALVAAAREYREIEVKTQAMESTSKDWEALEKDGTYVVLGERIGKVTASLNAMAEKGCGPFWKGRDESNQPVIDCWLHGWMTVSWLVGGQTKELKVAVRCPVLVIPPDGLGAVGPVMGSYETMLQREGRDYTLQVPVSHVVKPGGVARFNVTLGVPESGQHEFSVVLATADGGSIDGGKVALSGFLPRAAEADMRSAAQSHAE